MKKYLILPILIITSIYSLESLATGSTDSSSSDLVPTNTAPMMKCPKIDIGSLTLNSTPQYLVLNSSDCVSQGTAPGTVVVGGFVSVIVMAGVLNPSCPTDRPYLAAFNDIWGVGGGIGAAGLNYVCCALPQQWAADRAWGNYTTPSDPVNECP